MKRHMIIVLYFALTQLACHHPTEETNLACDTVHESHHKYALLSSRIHDLDELNNLMKIDYVDGNTYFAKKGVRLSFCSDLGLVYSELNDGLAQDEAMKAIKAGLSEKLNVLKEEPKLIQHRKHLKDIYLLARRRHDVYGYGDVAFYDLALEASKRIKVDEQAFSSARDSSEKGYINTFNHITAQAIITSIYSSSLADLIADVHERYNMPELISGEFSSDQLESVDNNPIDNYVDIINNEIGQLLGAQLKEKYSIEVHQSWTNELLCNYLNDLQKFYSKAFKINLKPFHEDDVVIIQFCKKLNSYHKIKYQSRPS